MLIEIRIHPEERRISLLGDVDEEMYFVDDTLSLPTIVGFSEGTPI